MKRRNYIFYSTKYRVVMDSAIISQYGITCFYNTASLIMDTFSYGRRQTIYTRISQKK